jgi:hypothetical protein
MAIDRPFGLVLSCLVLTALSACSSRPDVDPESAPALSAMAHALMDRNPRSDTVQYPPWPPEIRELLDPEQIRIHPEGVYIATDSSFVEEDGVFVPRDVTKFRPDSSGDPRYTPVALDVFTYPVAG